jgi:hypothetical protein
MVSVTAVKMMMRAAHVVSLKTGVAQMPQCSKNRLKRIQGASPKRSHCGVLW